MPAHLVPVIIGVFVVVSAMVAAIIAFSRNKETALSFSPEVQLLLVETSPEVPPGFSKQLFEDTREALRGQQFEPLCDLVSETLLQQGHPNYMSVWHLRHEVTAAIEELLGPMAGIYLSFESFFSDGSKLTTSNNKDLAYFASKRRRVIALPTDVPIGEMFEMHWAERSRIIASENVQAIRFPTAKDYIARNESVPL